MKLSVVKEAEREKVREEMSKIIHQLTLQIENEKIALGASGQLKEAKH